VSGKVRCPTQPPAARSSVFLASSEEAADITGQHFESKAQPKRPSALALDVGNQERAWELAATLVANAPTAAGIS
jgi:hypothetical protein